ncbi:hypothetical protein F5Y19DRAFT_365738 [Xylariaceae sp. FL1651]|nr:hypothetical protein F5Y19DRAFT_365738 [Xylariaceae sp. FL1651]
MALSAFDNIFFRLPPATAVLLLSAALGLTSGHALPRQTKVIEYRELDVIPFPPAPTNAPLSPFDLQRRQENTICGFIGGNPELPATCSLGSHCVLDPVNSVVGCCPNGETCTTGVYTSCVDRNSDPQTEINPYVFTCQGSDVCFRNQFAGGYHQFGCGTASDLGTTVQTSADGASTALSIETVPVSLTASASTLATPTTIGSFSSVSTRSSSASSMSSSSRSSTSSRSSSSTSSSVASSTTHSSSTSSSSDPASSATSTQDSGSIKQTQTGAIVGGVIGGAAAILSLLALAFYCLRRRGRNSRKGPGPAPTAPPTTQYISPMRSHGAAFAPLPSWNDEDNGGPSSPSFYNNAHAHAHQPSPYGPLEPTGVSAPAPANLTPHGYGFSQPLRYNPSYMAMGMPMPAKAGLTPVVEEEQPFDREEQQQHQQQYQQQYQQQPQLQGREIDEFSRAYSNAGIGQLPDDEPDYEDRAPLRDHAAHEAGNSTESSSEDSPPRNRGAGHRPLWQQNRQQSRNLMWL